MKKKILWCLLVLMFIVGVQISMPSEAAEQYVSSVAWDTPQKVKGATFVAKRHKVGSRYLSKIVMKKNGRSTTILSGIEAAFVTNGKVLYYSKQTKQIDSYSWKNTVYCYDIKSKKSKKITSGTNYTVRGCSGAYLYYGQDNWGDGVNLYAINIKTKKKKHMVNYVGSVIVSKGKVMTTTNSGDANNNPICVFDLNGSGKKKVAEGRSAVIKKGKIYYVKINLKTRKCKVYQCSLKGKNKKAVTGWLNRVPSKYL